jgi:glycosyltransferase involved in cell wall biosynthesis
MVELKINKKIRIGVDARLLSEPITGIGRYLFEVLSRMTSEGHEWYLYSHRPIIIGNWDRENIFIRSMRLKGRATRMIWAQSVLPYLAFKDQVDIFWSPAHRIPRFLNSKIPCVVTIHDLVWRHAGQTMRPMSRWLDSKLMMAAAKKANAIIAVSKSTASDLILENQDLSSKISVICLGVSLKISKPLNEELLNRIASVKPYYLFVGTLEPRKNLERLIHAHSILPFPIRNEAKLLIVGGKGWGDVNIQKIVKKFYMQENVEFWGYVDDSVLAGLYSNALFLAMPSLYEGFGLPLIEAMAFSIPVLTSDRSSMPEVGDGAGVFVDPHNVSSISKGLGLLLSDPSLRKNLGYHAAIRAKNFDWNLTANETLAVFFNVLTRANRLI